MHENKISFQVYWLNINNFIQEYSAFWSRYELVVLFCMVANSEAHQYENQYSKVLLHEILFAPDYLTSN